MNGTIFGREPVAIAGTIAIVLNLALAFGLHWTAEQVALTNAFVVALLNLLARNAVTPLAQPSLPLGTSVVVRGTADSPPGAATVTMDG